MKFHFKENQVRKLINDFFNKLDLIQIHVVNINVGGGADCSNKRSHTHATLTKVNTNFFAIPKGSAY